MTEYGLNLMEGERENIEKKTRFCLTVLNNIKNKVIATFEEIIRMDNIKHDPTKSHDKFGNEFLLRTVAGVLGVYGVEIEKFEDVVENFRINEKVNAQYKHDLSSYFSPVFTTFKLLTEEIDDVTPSGNLQDQEDKENKIRQYISEIIHFWYRCQVSLEDLLLRNLSEEKIPEEYCRGVDNKVIKGVLEFFSKEEVNNLIIFSREKQTPYEGIEDRNLEIADIDWERLIEELGDRKIKGNEGLVGNFLINALRNSLKERIDSNNVRLKMYISGDELVIRIEDDGKGMEQKHLDPNFLGSDPDSGEREDYFIFNKGVSDTAGSGLGLANFNTRLASTGGAVYVISKRRDSGKEEKPIRYQFGGTNEKKEAVEFNLVESGTIFEIHLKLENKSNEKVRE